MDFSHSIKRRKKLSLCVRTYVLPRARLEPVKLHIPYNDICPSLTSLALKNFLHLHLIKGHSSNFFLLSFLNE